MARISVQDAVFLLALIALSALVIDDWSAYADCRHPINVWLLVDFALLVVFRGVHYGLPSLVVEGRASWVRKVVLVNIAVLYPFCWAWTIIGIVWLYRASDCLPPSMSSWWMGLWLAYCIIYLTIYAFAIYRTFAIARHADELRSMEHLLALLQVAQDQAPALRPALSDEQVAALPTRVLHADEVAAATPTCAICLVDLAPGELVRDIPCRHLFHASCLDPWLRLRGTCPYCVRAVPSERQPLLSQV